MSAPLGDHVRVTASVRGTRERVFALFTAGIDQWWRRGKRFRNAGANPGTIHLEPGIDGRFYERWEEDGQAREFEIGRVTRWDPPTGLSFSWRNSVFAEDEITYVDVDFAEHEGVTGVTIVHRGWASIRADHPARHGDPLAVFQGSLGQWWGDQAMHLRLAARAPERE